MEWTRPEHTKFRRIIDAYFTDELVVLLNPRAERSLGN
jgi:hypothetical protein